MYLSGIRGKCLSSPGSKNRWYTFVLVIRRRSDIAFLCLCYYLEAVFTDLVITFTPVIVTPPRLPDSPPFQLILPLPVCRSIPPTCSSPLPHCVWKYVSLKSVFTIPNYSVIPLTSSPLQSHFHPCIQPHVFCLSPCCSARAPATSLQPPTLFSLQPRPFPIIVPVPALPSLASPPRHAPALPLPSLPPSPPSRIQQCMKF